MYSQKKLGYSTREKKTGWRKVSEWRSDRSRGVENRRRFGLSLRGPLCNQKLKAFQKWSNSDERWQRQTFFFEKHAQMNHGQRYQ